MRGIICAAMTASCICFIERERCDGRHLCDCGGSWRNDANSGTDVLLFPISRTLGWAETVKESEALWRHVAKEAGES